MLILEEAGKGYTMDHRLDQIKRAIITGNHKDIERIVKAAIEDEVELNTIINDAMIAAMDVVGQKFAKNEIFVPEMLVSAVTMKKGLNLVKPYLKDKDTESKGTVVMCTVKGDMHDIGKNLVIIMLEGAGFTVVDLGIDVSVETMIEKIQEINPMVLGLSALLTTTMPEMQHVTETLTAQGLRDGLKIMVGGAPVDAEFAEKIGADGYAENAAKAVEVTKSLILKI